MDGVRGAGTGTGTPTRKRDYITREGPLGQTWRALRRWYIGISSLGSVLGLELGVRC
jgi:hypothetical protein